jgi:hypothetical protein
VAAGIILLGHGGLNEESLLLKNRGIAVHEMSERTKIVLIEQRDRELGLEGNKYKSSASISLVLKYIIMYVQLP